MFRRIGLIGMGLIFLFISLDVYIIYEHPWIRTYNTTPHPGGNALIEIITWTMFIIISFQIIAWIILSYSKSISKEKDKNSEMTAKFLCIFFILLSWCYILYLSIGYYNSGNKHYTYLCTLQLLFGALGILLAIISILGFISQRKTSAV